MSSVNFSSQVKVALVFGVLLLKLNAFSQGHYNGGSFNPNDYFVPASQGWVFSLYYSYSQMDYFNDERLKTDIIEISQNPPFSVELGQNVSTSSVIPMLIYFGKGKILNARWGMLALPIFNSPNANIALDFYFGQSSVVSHDINFKTFGFGDFYLQPAWLTWEKEQLVVTFSYGVWVPTGRYEINSTDNIGLGYWSHNLRVAGRYISKSGFVGTGAMTLELNNKQKDDDFTEGPHLTFDYGGAYIFPKGHEAGIFGYGTWQMGDDKGEEAVTLKDQSYGLGMYGSYWIKPGKFGVLSRISTNFATKNRFGGLSFQLGLNYLLIK